MYSQKHRLSLTLSVHAIAIASTLLAGPALAHHGDGREFRGHGNLMRDLRQSNQDWSTREIRQMVRAERIETIQQRIPTPAARPHLQLNTQTTNALLNRRFDGQSVFLSANGATRRLSHGVELDLTSTKRGITLGDDLFSNTSLYTIEVGGTHKQLVSGAEVSAAEFVALKQVIDSGSQSLVIDASGKAVDGSFNLNTITDGSRDIHAQSLVVPASVQASGDFGRNSDFRISGDLTNFGSVIATSSIRSAHQANISARDITNSAGATIETVSSSAAGSIDLHLTADRNFQNDGSIKSSGNLSITAGTSLQNSGKIEATNDLNVSVATITNSGSLVSSKGNVNFSTPLPSDIVIENTGGIVSALNGAINVRDTGCSESFNTTLNGGDWQSSIVNLNAGTGHLEVNVHKLSGAVYAHADSAVINAQTDLLNIQELDAKGDPLISNTSTIMLGSQTASGAPLSVVSGADIVLNSATLSTNSASGSAGNITLIAGAAFTTNPGDIVISGASATGGNISFTGSAPIITANSTAGNAGTVTLAAFAAGANTGVIDLAGSTINATGKIGSSNGDVSVIAGGGITLGSINTEGPSKTTGLISISGSQPQVVGTLTIDNTTGAILSGGLTAGSTISGAFTANGTINAGDSLVVKATSAVFTGAVSARDIVVTTAGKIDVDTSMTATNGDIRITSTGKADLNLRDLQADSIAMTTLGSIRVNGTWSTAGSGGGIVAVAGGTITASVLQDSKIDTSAAGQSGDVTLVAAATFTQTAGTITITGSEIYNADITLTGPFQGINTSAVGTGSGGNITLIAYSTSVSLGQNALVNTAGAGVGNSNGDILIMASNPAGSLIHLGPTTSTSSGLSGSGSITLVTALADYNVVLDKHSGGVLSGNFLPAAPVLHPFSNVQGRANATVNTMGAPLIILVGADIDLAGTTTTVGSATITAGSKVLDAGNITANSISVTAGSSIALGGNLSSPSINLTSQNGGNITQSGMISTSAIGTLTVSLLGTTPGDALLFSSNSVGTLIGQGGGILALNNGTTDLKLGAIGSTQNLYLTVDGNLTYLGGINTSGIVQIYTQKFLTNGTSLSAATIQIQPATATGTLTIDGGTGSSLTATTPVLRYSVGGPPTPPTVIFPPITLGSTSGADLTLAGKMNLFGDAEIDSASNLISQNGSLFTGANNVTLNTLNWIQQGNGNIVGNKLIYTGTGIINPDGDVVLLNNLVFHGRDLVIAAKDNVNLGAFNIDLSSSIGNGGSLTIFAGCLISGPGPGQIQTAGPFTVATGPGASSKNIVGTGLITTSSTAADGAAGNISISATGSISLLGAIDASSDTGVGGTVALAAPNGITVGSITAVSPQQSGSVFVRPSFALTYGEVTYRNGQSIGPGIVDFVNNDPTSSPISLASVSAFNVNLQNLQAPITISGSLSGHHIIIKTTGSLDFSTTNTLAATEFLGDGGILEISTPAISTFDGSALKLVANGSLRGGGVIFDAPGSLTVGTTGSITIDVRDTGGGGPLTGGGITLNAIGKLTVDASAALAGDTGTYHFFPKASGSTPGELVITGNIVGNEILIETQSKNSFDIGADQLPRNGVQGTLTANNIEIKNTVGNISILHSNSINGTDIKLQTTGKSMISLEKNGVLKAANSLTLLTELADIGKKTFNIDAAIVNLTSLGGSVNVTDIRNGDVELRTASAGKSFSFTAAGGLRVSFGATAEQGSITLVAGANDLIIQDPIIASNGSVSLCNSDTVNGDIIIARPIQSFGKGKSMIIAIGELKKPKTDSPPPFFVTVNQSRGGKVVFGPGGVMAGSPATVTADKKSVYFNNQGAGTIFLGPGNIITASSN